MTELADLLSIKQACELLGISRRTLYRRIETGAIKPVEGTNGRPMFDRADLLEPKFDVVAVRTPDPRDTTQCLALTAKGERCKRHTESGAYCPAHDPKKAAVRKSTAASGHKAMRESVAATDDPDKELMSILSSPPKDKKGLEKLGFATLAALLRGKLTAKQAEVAQKLLQQQMRLMNVEDDDGEDDLLDNIDPEVLKKVVSKLTK